MVDIVMIIYEFIILFITMLLGMYKVILSLLTFYDFINVLLRIYDFIILSNDFKILFRLYTHLWIYCVLRFYDVVNIL